MKLIFIGGVILLLACGFMVVLDKLDIHLETEDNVTIYNPATGEKWNSVEEYMFRKINWDEEMNRSNGDE